MLPLTPKLPLSLHLLSLIALSSVLIYPSKASADRRAYVWTYEYMTMPQGELELENYFDFRSPDWGNMSTSSWIHQVELEYGITDYWDLALYQVFSQNDTESYKYSRMKVRTRYRLFEAGLFIVDPLLYLEYQRPSNTSKPNLLEGKLVLARDFEQFNLATNFILEKELVAGSEWETGYALGGNYQFTPAFEAGLEITGNFDSGSQNQTHLGPTVSFASPKFFISAGALWGANDRSDDFRVRYILGLEL
jgi:hypothetical protein